MHHVTIVTLIDVLFGFSAAYNTCVYIPQIIRLIKIKKATELSLTMFLLFNITLLIQILYTTFITFNYEYAVGMSFVLASCAIVTYLIIYYRVKNLIEDYQSEKDVNKSQPCLAEFFTQKLKRTIMEHKKPFITGILILLVIISATLIVRKLWAFNSESSEILTTLFYSGFIVVGFSFILQILQVLRQGHAEEFSVLTFAGFNVIQFVTALYAYFHHIFPLLLGMVFYLFTSGSLTLLILIYKWKNKEFHYHHSS